MEIQAGQRGIRWSDIPAKEGWPHQYEVAGSGLRVTDPMLEGHMHTPQHTCARAQGLYAQAELTAGPTCTRQAAAAHQLEQG